MFKLHSVRCTRVSRSAPLRTDLISLESALESTLGRPAHIRGARKLSNVITLTNGMDFLITAAVLYRISWLKDESDEGSSGIACSGLRGEPGGRTSWVPGLKDKSEGSSGTTCSGLWGEPGGSSTYGWVWRVNRLFRSAASWGGIWSPISCSYPTYILWRINIV